jgi:hypothetical protein
MSHRRLRSSAGGWFGRRAVRYAQSGSRCPTLEMPRSESAMQRESMTEAQPVARERTMKVSMRDGTWSAQDSRSEHLPGRAGRIADSREGSQERGADRWRSMVSERAPKDEAMSRSKRLLRVVAGVLVAVATLSLPVALIDTAEVGGTPRLAKHGTVTAPAANGCRRRG